MHRTHLLIALICLLLPGTLRAQETEPPPADRDRDTHHPGERPSMRRGGPYRSFGEHGEGFQGNRSDGFEAWMKRIKEQDPVEYERLQRLKEEDPQALRQAGVNPFPLPRPNHPTKRPPGLPPAPVGLTEEVGEVPVGYARSLLRVSDSRSGEFSKRWRAYPTGTGTLATRVITLNRAAA